MSVEQESFSKKVDEFLPIFNFLMDEFKNLNEILGQNLVYAEKINDTSLLESIIRMQIRTTVSIIESSCFLIRNIAYDFCAIKNFPIPNKYLDLFKAKNRIELKDKLKLSIQFVGFSTSGIDKIDVQSNEWQSVCELIIKRHGITHPRDIYDMKVSKTDLDNSYAALLWFTKQMYHVFGKDISNISFEVTKDDINKTIKQFKEKYS